MKITFLLPTVNMSGGIRVIAIYAKWLVDRGHQVVLISPPARRPSLRQRMKASLRLRKFNTLPKSHLDGLGLDHRVLDAFRPVVEGDVPDADVVIATWWETAEWVARLSVEKGEKIYFVQGHEVFPWLPIERCRATYRLALRKIVVAEWLRRTMIAEYGDPNVCVVPNGVDHAQFHAEPRGKQPEPTIGFLYSDVGIKGVDVALRAIALIRQRMPNLRLVSFGMAMPPASLMADAAFHFDPPQSALRDFYGCCDVWLTASRSEGFNLPAMEAMACRTPVVATRTGWPEEAIVDGVNGYCVDIDDVQALADAACRLLELPEEQWREVSGAAFETVRTCSWTRSADLFEQTLCRLVDAQDAHQTTRSSLQRVRGTDAG